MQLNQIQSDFIKGLKNFSIDPKFIQGVKPAGKISLDQAVEIYHQMYFLILLEELNKSYPSVKWVLGEDHFKETCRRFIESQPAVNYNLLSYGREFPDFLSINSSTQKIPFLHDLASFEWLYKETSNQPPASSLDEDEIFKLTLAPDYKLEFIDSLKIFTSPYSVFEIWHRRDEPPYMFNLMDWLRQDSLLLYKREKQTEVIQIQDVEAEILISLMNGLSMKEALADYSGRLTPDKIAQFLYLIKTAKIIESVQVV